jgi:hypothetical protein
MEGQQDKEFSTRLYAMQLNLPQRTQISLFFPEYIKTQTQLRNQWTHVSAFYSTSATQFSYPTKNVVL